ncbi:MAG TPA: hypothetical protein VKA65_01320, partial [Acidimicrobiales bacterium]|nr:hypothetical protein [Acidimicrobiales bacterium]
MPWAHRSRASFLLKVVSAKFIMRISDSCRAVVTGGGSRIGAATAHRLVASTAAAEALPRDGAEVGHPPPPPPEGVRLAGRRLAEAHHVAPVVHARRPAERPAERAEVDDAPVAPHGGVVAAVGRRAGTHDDP